eukprot:gnl/Hemi2/28812_TR9553_c0_g4_i1.p2 gnl/Hemi2/28812_TR9553_c0_g4~~gnl/Hemi2/28812_TR9553_c0_g4_i1.p2  ORF type:complete len:201 (-),score=55.09 gnl/Hemi2/28812_TR9553_c0_g4_i1:95-697(-)
MKCAHGGTCDPNSHTCQCPPGYSGDDCSDVRCPNSCSHHGTCDLTTGKCTCVTPFTGLDCSVSCSGGQYQLDVFPSTDLTGSGLNQSACVSGPSIAAMWDKNPPLDSSGAPLCRFSAKWRGEFPFQAGQYKFSGSSRDGIRAYLDGNGIVDNWYADSGEFAHTHKFAVPGNHRVEVEFYSGCSDPANTAGFLKFSVALLA